MLSNKELQAVLDEVNPFKSSFTGPEIESGIKDAREVIPFISANLSIPAGTFTGDLLRTPITTVTRSMWLHSIVILVKRPMSESASSISYQIIAGSKILLSLDSEWMMTPDFHMEIIIDTMIDPGVTIDMVCSSTQAFGEVLVKLNVY